jgi:hypothetical protein
MAFAQGQDSTTWARDKMVIAEMLPGVYSNTNQVYFDTRTGLAESERRGPVVVAVTAAEGEADTFRVTASWNRAEAPAWEALLVLGLDDTAGLVTMRVTSGDLVCDYAWAREATQFRAALRSGCMAPLFSGMILS